MHSTLYSSSLYSISTVYNLYNTPLATRWALPATAAAERRSVQ